MKIEWKQDKTVVTIDFNGFMKGLVTNWLQKM